MPDPNDRHAKPSLCAALRHSQGRWCPSPRRENINATRAQRQRPCRLQALCPARTTGRLGCMNFSMTQTITVDSINTAACAKVPA